MARLLPWQVREYRFRPARFGRRGLDPGEVRAFLDRVAVELAAAHDALRASRLEAARLRYELRRAEQVPQQDADRPTPGPNAGRQVTRPNVCRQVRPPNAGRH